MAKTRAIRWCHSCHSKYRGKYLTCCNMCFKWKKAENRLCKNCRSPDCLTPEFYPHAIDRKIRPKEFKMNPDWDFRGVSIADMENSLPVEPHAPYDED